MIYDILDDNGAVINTIIADEAFVEANYPGHYRFVGPEPLPYYGTVVSKIAFRFRFTDQEYVGILTAAKTNIEVASWVETFNMATTIDLANPHTKSGLEKLVVANLLTQPRADEILNAPVQAGEVP